MNRNGDLESAAWADFERRLTAAIIELEPESFVILALRNESSVYVQFMRAGRALHAEAVSNEYLPADRQLDGAGVQRLRDAGWSEPAGGGNWTRSLELPAATDELAAYVSECVAALHDVYDVEAPAQLTYQAQRLGVAAPLALDLGIANRQEEPTEAAPADAPTPPPAPVSAMFRALQNVADRYDSAPGWDRPPLVFNFYTPELVLDGHRFERGLAEHPLALLDFLKTGRKIRKEFKKSFALGVATEGWTYPADVLAQAAAAVAADPGFDILATYGPPSAHPGRVELSSLTIVCRNGRVAQLNRARLPEQRGAGGFLDTDLGDQLSGAVPAALAAALEGR